MTEVSRVEAWRVIRRALGVARHEPWRVFGGAVLVFAPFAALQAGAVVLVDHIRADQGQVTGLVAIALLPATTATIWGSALFAGVLERTVGAHHYGAERRSALALVRGLPLGRLIVADVVLGVLVLLGWALFVLPGGARVDALRARRARRDDRRPCGTRSAARRSSSSGPSGSSSPS